METARRGLTLPPMLEWGKMLGINIDSVTRFELVAAYRNIRTVIHPDRNPGISVDTLELIGSKYSEAHRAALAGCLFTDQPATPQAAPEELRTEQIDHHDDLHCKNCLDSLRTGQAICMTCGYSTTTATDANLAAAWQIQQAETTYTESRIQAVQNSDTGRFTVRGPRCSSSGVAGDA